MRVDARRGPANGVATELIGGYQRAGVPFSTAIQSHDGHASSTGLTPEST